MLQLHRLAGQPKAPREMGQRGLNSVIVAA